jgi:hypothetical protein
MSPNVIYLEPMYNRFRTELAQDMLLTASQVGIEDCLHIEFEYNKTKYHLKDVVIGKIYFLLVRLKIKHMELEVRRRESTGTGSDLYNESETITKFEIMDGAPVRAALALA